MWRHTIALILYYALDYQFKKGHIQLNIFNKDYLTNTWLP